MCVADRDQSFGGWKALERADDSARIVFLGCFPLACGTVHSGRDAGENKSCGEPSSEGSELLAPSRADWWHLAHDLARS